MKHHRSLLIVALSLVGAFAMACAFTPLACAQDASSSSAKSTTHSMGIFYGKSNSTIRAAATNLVYQDGAVETTPVVFPDSHLPYY